MIRTTLILFTLLSAQLVVAQDVIVFSDGRIKDVKIVDVKESKKTIYYVKRKETLSVFIDEILQYKWRDTWYHYNKKLKEIDSSKTSIYFIKRNALMVPSNYTYDKYSVSVTFSPPLNGDSRMFRNVSAADNYRIRVEPEISVYNWLSVKFPIVFGLNFEQDYPGIKNYPGSVNNSGYGGPGDYRSLQGINFVYEAYNDLSIKPTYGYASSNYYYYYGYYGNDPDYGKNHINELLYQIGITPKFYPFGQDKKIALYLSQSFNVGMGNKNRVDYYASFEPDKFYSYSLGDSIDTWGLAEEIAVAYRDNFLYFRYEAMLGFNFNVTPSINFCFESGVTGMIRNRSVEDQIYIKTPGTGYELSATRIYEFEPRRNGIGIPALWSNRFHIVYKLGGKRTFEPKIDN